MSNLVLCFTPSRARTRAATWLQTALALVIPVVLVVVDLITGWLWWHVALAAINVGIAVQFARGALGWHEPQRALDETSRAR